ncbi:hypothetical protein K1719_013886 [Acacia pycnantha]|nr:hypothetical protein K1719_013886 [Acacia pycnantha]
MASHSELSHSLLFPFLLLLLLSITTQSKPLSFSNIREATVNDLQLAFHRIHLTSRKLIELYIQQIHKLNHILKGVLELNPDALAQADRADQERRCAGRRPLPKLHGITILVKDNIATKDQMNTTAGLLLSLSSESRPFAGEGETPVKTMEAQQRSPTIPSSLTVATIEDVAAAPLPLVLCCGSHGLHLSLF